MSASKSISLSELFDEEKGPIWVVNSSSEVYREFGGSEVYVNIKNGDQSSVFRMPRTWLPREITSMFPRKNILASSYFIEAVNKKLLKIISTEEAQRILARPGAAQEQARLDELQKSIEEASRARGIGKGVMITTGDPDLDEKDSDNNKENFVKSTVNFDDDEEEPKVSPGFIAWVNRLNENAEDTVAYENEVRNRGEMTVDEATYLKDACKNPEIKARLEKKLRKLQG